MFVKVIMVGVFGLTAAFANPSIADTSSSSIFGISPSVEPENFPELVQSTLSDFRGGWICVSIENGHSCYSNDSDIEQLDVTDASISLLISEDTQTLVVSCGTFDACDNFNVEGLTPAFEDGSIFFPTENARLLEQGGNVITEFPGGALVVDTNDRYLKLAVWR